MSPETIILKSQKGRLTKNDLKLCVEVVAQGGLIIFPTDTVYGLACNAFHMSAIKRVYEIKGRSYTKALPILLGEPNQLLLIAKEILPQVDILTDAFWPGALTLIFKTSPLALVATRGKDTVAVRVPDHRLSRAILNGVKVPLATTSVNISGQPSVTNGKEAIRLFDGRVDLIVDGGECEWKKESSVVDVTHFPFTLLREGVVKKSTLTKKLKLA